MDVIDQESYKSGYKSGVYACRSAIRKRFIREYERFVYYLKQKLLGIFLLAVSILAVILMEGDATVALFTVPLGLFLIFSKKMILMNNFYWEEKRKWDVQREDEPKERTELMKKREKSF